MKSIVVLDQKTLGDDISLDILKKHGQLTSYEQTLPNEVESRIKNAEIIILNKVKLNKENLKAAKKLKLICLLATGYNNIDIQFCKENGIAVCNVAGYSTNSVCQHTFALALSLIEKVRFYDDFVKSGEYTNKQIATNHEKPYNEIFGKTWGIIGMGNIGKAVANVAKAFGCRVIYYSTSGVNLSAIEYESVSLEEILQQSDILSIHCPLNEKTKNLICFNEIKTMKKSVIIINMARGGVVNENDLVNALKENLIKGACIDVFENEPILQNSQFTNKEIAQKLILSPHIAWASVEARNRLVSIVSDNIEQFYHGNNFNRIV